MNVRLQWFIEKQEILPSFQIGFRKNRSTTDSIVSLENEIQKNIAIKQHTVAIFLDIEKAYDTLWVDGLISNLYDIGIRGKTLSFINNSLRNRTFQVKIENTLSHINNTENGLSQGSTISPILFNLMLCQIPTTPLVSISLYADDCAIWTSGPNINFIVNRIQNCLNNVQIWFEQRGFNLSENKSTPVLFSNSNRTNLPKIKLKEKELQFQANHKFLGVTFDKKLTWNTHTQDIRNRCRKKLIS